MRLTELWEGRCVCGADVSSPKPDFICRKCGRGGRFERPECRLRWEPTSDTTLSEREGVK